MWSWRRTFLRHLEGDQLAIDAFFLLRGKHVSSDERPLVKRDKLAEPGLQRRRFFRNVIPVEWITHLQPQCITRAQPARPDAEGLSPFQQARPQRRRIRTITHNFESILTRVPRACHPTLPAKNSQPRDAEMCESRRFREYLRGGRTLQRQRCHLVAQVVEHDSLSGAR